MGKHIRDVKCAGKGLVTPYSNVLKVIIVKQANPVLYVIIGLAESLAILARTTGKYFVNHASNSVNNAGYGIAKTVAVAVA